MSGWLAVLLFTLMYPVEDETKMMNVGTSMTVIINAIDTALARLFSNINALYYGLNGHILALCTYVLNRTF
jgi:hypothetical protein